MKGLMVTQRVVALALVMAPILAIAQTSDKSTQRKKKDDSIANGLDPDQNKSLKRLKAMFTKLDGRADVPENAREEVRDTLHQSLSALHAPDRSLTDQWTNDLMGHLSKRQLSPATGFQLVEGVALLLREETVSKESFNRYMAETRSALGRSQVPMEDAEQMEKLIGSVIRKAPIDDEYLREKKKRETQEEIDRKKESDKQAKQREARRKLRGGN